MNEFPCVSILVFESGKYIEKRWGKWKNRDEMVLRWQERGSVCGGRTSELERESDREGSVSEFAYVPREQACVCIWIWARSQEWDWHLQESLMDIEPETCHAWKVGHLCVYMHACCFLLYVSTCMCVFDRKSNSIRECLLDIKREGGSFWLEKSLSSISVSFVCHFPFLFL